MFYNHKIKKIYVFLLIIIFIICSFLLCACSQQDELNEVSNIEIADSEHNANNVDDNYDKIENLCEVVFDSTGGTSINKIIVEKNTKIKKFTNPTKVTFTELYEFIGWYDSNDKLWDFDSDTVKENITLTAKWRLIETYSKIVNP